MSDFTTFEPHPPSTHPENSDPIANQPPQDQILTPTTDTMQTPADFYEKQAAPGSAGALPVTDGTITTTTAASTAVPDAAASPAGTTALGSAAPNPAIPGAVGSPAQSVPTPAVATAGSPATQPAVQPPAVPIMPTEAAVNGSSTRQWVNEKLTQHVLDAMKEIARSRPEKPLLALGQFLVKRSQQVEGPGADIGAPSGERKEEVEEEMKDAE